MRPRITLKNKWQLLYDVNKVK